MGCAHEEHVTYDHEHDGSSEVSDHWFDEHENSDDSNPSVCVV